MTYFDFEDLKARSGHRPSANSLSPDEIPTARRLDTTVPPD